MSNPAQIASQIRFHLNQMGAQNQHHGFEHLARHLARLRVYSNILPATGPVSGGGDQGRDFETFRTEISVPPTAGSHFHRFQSGDRNVAFACTLDKRITSKIRRDVTSILSNGAVDEIVYFCEPDLPIAKRHELQAWAKKLGVALQIFDGQAISEMLAEHETFWIAQQYLILPSELVLPTQYADDWYIALKRRWADREPLAISRADFVEIKNGLRHATFNLETRQDLLQWIAKMRLLQGEFSTRAMRRNSAYEIAVATLRGKGELTSQVAALDDYFSDIELHIELADLTDAATLLTYAFGAVVNQHLDIDDDKLFHWLVKLDTILNAETTGALGPGRRSSILFILGQLHGLPSPKDRTIDLSRSVTTWHEMLDHAIDAPVFPLESFADFLRSLMVRGGARDDLVDLLNRADDMLLARSGKGAIGERAFEIGNLLREGDRNLAALDQLHKAKLNWFSGEDLYDALRAMLVIADVYKYMGLAFAAKHYALAVAFMANYEQGDSIKTLLPHALFKVAEIETGAGHTLNSVQALIVAIGSNLAFGPDPLDLDKHASAKELLAQLGVTIGLIRKGDPDLEPAIVGALAGWPSPLKDFVLSVGSSNEGYWLDREWTRVWSDLQTAYMDRLFTDAGARRTATWSALGIRWTVEFDNTYEMTALAEQFLSELQILLVEVARIDLAFLPTAMHLRLSLGEKCAAGAAEPNSDDVGGAFDVTLGAGIAAPNMPAYTHLLLSILSRASLLPDHELMPTIQHHLSEALGRSFVARPYQELYEDHVSPAAFLGELRRGARPMCPNLDFAYQEDSELSWCDTHGPTYDASVAAQSIEKRYEEVGRAVRFTVRRLVQHPETRRHLQTLKARGARDWEILSVVGNIATHLRLGEFTPNYDLDAYRAKAFELMSFSETEEVALQPDQFTDELFSVCEILYLRAHIDSWGLATKPDFKDVAAVMPLYVVRLRPPAVKELVIFVAIGVAHRGGMPRNAPLSNRGHLDNSPLS